VVHDAVELHQDHADGHRPLRQLIPTFSPNHLI
jgi:hypothetical protein